MARGMNSGQALWLSLCANSLAVSVISRVCCRSLSTCSMACTQGEMTHRNLPSYRHGEPFRDTGLYLYMALYDDNGFLALHAIALRQVFQGGDMRRSEPGNCPQWPPAPQTVAPLLPPPLLPPHLPLCLVPLRVLLPPLLLGTPAPHLQP